MLLASRCGSCARPGPSPCAGCHALLRRPAADVDPPGLPGLVALLRYDGPARPLVARVKYRNQRQVVAWLADGLVALLEGSPVDIVTWAPTTAEHRRRRGFDHGEVLARAVARRIGRPVRSLLTRGPGPPQTGRDARHRRASPPAFTCRSPVPPGTRVLVVDDIVTTGATLRAATAALRAAGATALPACAARTPPPEAR